MKSELYLNLSLAFLLQKKKLKLHEFILAGKA
jgi:hypothetical protein